MENREEENRLESWEESGGLVVVAGTLPRKGYHIAGILVFQLQSKCVLVWELDQKDFCSISTQL